MHTEAAREQMIEQQVRAWEVLDERVLGILRLVPRERLVAAQYRFLAFADVEIPLPHGETHSSGPASWGGCCRRLRLRARSACSKWAAARASSPPVLPRASREVHSVELHADIAELARANLAEVKVANAQVVNDDALALAPGHRYEAIALSASLPLYDERWQRQLAIGGRLFVVVGEPPVMEARLVRRLSEQSWSSVSLFETVIDPLRNAQHREQFRF